MGPLIIEWCRPVTDRVIANHDGYWQRYRWFIFAVCLAGVGDLLTTIHFMHIDGVQEELHPAVRIASMILGPIAGPLLGKSAQLVAIFIVTLYVRRLAGYFFFAATMMYGWATWDNLWGRDLYAPLLFELLPLRW